MTIEHHEFREGRCVKCGCRIDHPAVKFDCCVPLPKRSAWQRIRDAWRAAKRAWA